MPVASAIAGEYTVVTCQWPGAGGRNNSWAPRDTGFGASQPTAYRHYAECQPSGRGLQVETGGDATANWLTISEVGFDAPAGTRILKLSVLRSGEKRRYSDNLSVEGWAIYGQTAEGSPIGGGFGETCSTRNGAALCDIPNPGKPNPQAFDLNTTRVSYGVVCDDSSGCPTNFGGYPLAFMSVRGAAVTLSDASAPAVHATGTLFADGWVPASASMSADATDTSA